MTNRSSCQSRFAGEDVSVPYGTNDAFGKLMPIWLIAKPWVPLRTITAPFTIKYDPMLESVTGYLSPGSGP